MFVERRAAVARLMVALALAWCAGAAAQKPEPATAEPPVLGSRSTLSIAAPETVLLDAGTTLHRSPSPISPVLVQLEVDRELAIVERRPGWILVRFEDLRVWTRSGEPELGDEDFQEGIPEPLWLDFTATPERLSRAAELLSPSRSLTLGSYRLLTDLDPERERDARLLDRLERLSTEVERAYVERFGLPVPTPPQPQAVVLFARSGYRDFVAREGAIADVRSWGHSSPGMVVLDLTTLDDEEKAALFVHELVHLLNQRAFLRELPPWLEEGLAEELALSRVSQTGELEVGSLRGSQTRRRGRKRNQRGEEVEFTELVVRGPRATLSDVVSRWSPRGRADLFTLLELPWQEFALGAEWGLNYTESAFLLRYLLVEQEGRFREAMLDFLLAVRAGGTADALTLASRLGVDLLELELAFSDWLAAQTVEATNP